MDGLDAAATPPPPKQDPGALALRGTPRPVVRFKKGVIVIVFAIVMAGIVTLAWIAFEPHSLRQVVASETDKSADHASAEALAGTPASYDDVPKLGPPLPGDLGKPMLESEGELGTASPDGGMPVDQADQPAARREQAITSEKKALGSPLLVGLERPSIQEADSLEIGPSAKTDAALPTPATSRNEPKSTEHAEGEGGSNFIEPSSSPWTLVAGTIIPASLLTGLDSDLPGMVIAQVTENVRDSTTGRSILIPQGARLIGRYDSKVAYGQKRALVVWQRILFPDGSSLRLGNMPASDSAGFAGLSDRVDGHSWQLIKGVILSSLLGLGTELSFGGESGTAHAFRESLQQNGSQAGEQIVAKGLDVQPTISVRPGWPVRVLVSKDLVLKPWNG